jgi:hypothetical protein
MLESLGYKTRYRFTRYPLPADVQVTVNGWSPDFAVPGGFIDPTLSQVHRAVEPRRVLRSDNRQRDRSRPLAAQDGSGTSSRSNGHGSTEP